MKIIFVQIHLKAFAELQANTQIYGRRPFGVGLVIAGYDVSSYLVFSSLLQLMSSVLFQLFVLIVIIGNFTRTNMRFSEYHSHRRESLYNRSVLDLKVWKEHQNNCVLQG